MRFFATFLIIFLLFSCTKGTDVTTKQKPAGEQGSDVQYKTEMEELKKNLKGDVRIKLKKDGKGGYGWEITGKDAQEVLKANDTLKKRLSE